MAKGTMQPWLLQHFPRPLRHNPRWGRTTLGPHFVASLRFRRNPCATISQLESRRISMSLLLLGIVLLAGCAGAEFISVGPKDPQPARKLRLSDQEWQEIQSEFRKHRGDLIDPDLNVKWWGRSAITGLVEVACENPKSPSSGPVFFFRRDDGHWRILREISVWEKKDRPQW